MKRPDKTTYMAIMDMDDAIAGYAMRGGQLVLVYDFSKLVSFAMKKESLTLDEAIEFIEEGLEQSWIGNETPIIMHRANHNEIMEMFGDKADRIVN